MKQFGDDLSEIRVPSRTTRGGKNEMKQNMLNNDLEIASSINLNDSYNADNRSEQGENQDKMDLGPLMPRSHATQKLNTFKLRFERNPGEN